jgi:hypothetical protein
MELRLSSIPIVHVYVVELRDSESTKERAGRLFLLIEDIWRVLFSGKRTGKRHSCAELLDWVVCALGDSGSTSEN